MTKLQVQAAVEQLRAQGERISQNAIIKKLGGSKRDVGPLLKEILGELGACDEDSPGTTSTLPVPRPGVGPGLWVRITRPLPAGQRTYALGEVIDVSTWNARRVQLLLDQHWISVYTPSPPPPSVEERTARLMSAQATLHAHEEEQQTHQATLARLEQEYATADIAQQAHYDTYLDTNARMGAMEHLVGLDERVAMAQHRNEVVRETRRLARVAYVRAQDHLLGLARGIRETQEALEELVRQIRAEARLCWLLEHAPELQERLDHLGRELLRATDEYTRRPLREASKNAEAQAQALYAARHQAAAD